jgi:Mce-associated membrane protein
MTVTDADTPSETAPDTLVPARLGGPARHGVPPWVPLALALALVGALVAAGLFWHASSDHEKDASAAQTLISAGTDARAAAEAAAVSMTTYDYRTVDQDFAWIDTAGTEDFKKYFSGISAPAIKLVKQLKAAAQGTVVDSGVDVEDPTHVKVVLFVDQTITGKAEGTSAPDQSRIVMYMVLQDGRWLVDRMELKNYTRG